MKTMLVIIALSVLGMSLVAAATPCVQTEPPTTPEQVNSSPIVAINWKTTKPKPTESDSVSVLVPAAKHVGDNWLIVPRGATVMQTVKIQSDGDIERVTLRVAGETGSKLILVVNDVVFVGDAVTRTEDVMSASFERHAVAVKKGDVVLVGLLASSSSSVKLGCTVDDTYGDGVARILTHENSTNGSIDQDRAIDSVDLAFSVTVCQSYSLNDTKPKSGFFSALKFWE